VVANDSSPGRIAALRGVLRDWGAVNTAVTSFSGELFEVWFQEVFDCVLLDAPCSMENLRPARGHGQRNTTPRERESLAQRQLRLRGSALRAVKVGGRVVYSTCTLAPEEDERVLDGLLKLYKGAVEIVEPSGQFPHAPGLAGDETVRYDPSVQRALRLWPHTYGTSGFFTALLRKTASNSGLGEAIPGRPLEKLGWARLNAREEREITAYLMEEYGFDLPELLERQELDLWRRGEGIHALPEQYFRVLGGLKVEGLGLLLAEETPQGLQISHEWAARFGSQFQRGWVQLPAEQLPAWLRGEDVPLAGGEERGKTVLVKDEDDRILGRGKVQAQRLKNLLPRRLV
jgi:16S rRNA (cytosine1407-C5)-methyltransferase